MNFKWLLIFIFSLFIHTNVFGQTTAGCLLNNRVYYPYLGAVVIVGTRVYDIANSYPTVPNTCPGWATYPSTGGSCGVGLNVLGVVSLSLGGGREVNFTYIQCPLDDYSWAFGASAAILGIFVIRKRK